MNESSLLEQNTPVGSAVLIRKVWLQLKSGTGAYCGVPQYERNYGPIESATVQKWSKKGYVLLAFRSQSLWIDPKEYELCEVL